MQTVIYADLLVILNIVVTLIVIIITSDMLKIESRKTRYIAGSVSGGVMSLIMLAPPMNTFFSVLVRVCISAIIVLISFKVHKLKLYIKCFLMFNGVSLLLAGIMLAAGILINSNTVVSNNGYVYADFSISTIILIICASFFLIKIVHRKLFTKTKDDLIFDTEILYNGRKVIVKAFYDSGNSLKDIFTGRPVIIVSLNDASPLMDATLYSEVKSCFEKGVYEGFSGRIRLLPVRTLGNICFIPAFTAERAVVSGNDIIRIVEKPTIAISDNTFDSKEYGALINESVIGQVI